MGEVANSKKARYVQIYFPTLQPHGDGANFQNSLLGIAWNVQICTVMVANLHPCRSSFQKKILLGIKWHFQTCTNLFFPTLQHHGCGVKFQHLLLGIEWNIQICTEMFSFPTLHPMGMRIGKNYLCADLDISCNFLTNQNFQYIEIIRIFTYQNFQCIRISDIQEFQYIWILAVLKLEKNALYWNLWCIRICDTL